MIWRFVSQRAAQLGTEEVLLVERRLSDTLDRLVTECVVAYFDRATAELAREANHDQLRSMCAFDLVGNAAEWVADWFGGYSVASLTNPTGPSTGSVRIQRGGGWITPPADATSYGRRAEAPAASGSFSFRCARDAQP